MRILQSACLTVIIAATCLSADAAFAAPKKTVVRILGQKYRVAAVTGERRFSYHEGSYAGGSSLGEAVYPLEVSAVARGYQGFSLKFGGNATLNYSVLSEQGAPTHTCNETFNVSPFGADVSVYFQRMKRRVLVTATFGTDPMQPEYVSAYYQVCAESPSGIRAYILDVLETGSGNDECDGAELCTRINRRAMGKRRVNLKFSRDDVVLTDLGSTTLKTSMHVRLVHRAARRAGRKKR